MPTSFYDGEANVFLSFYKSENNLTQHFTNAHCKSKNLSL